MIEILGDIKGSEYEAAEKLKTLFLNIWPDLAKSQKDRLVVFVGYTVHEARIKDIDLIVIGDFADNRNVQFPIDPSQPSTRRGDTSKRTFKVKNFGNYKGKLTKLLNLFGNKRRAIHPQLS